MDKNMEEGECSSDNDSIAGYTPIERPVDTTRKNQPKEIIDDSDDDEGHALLDKSDSDSDDDRPVSKKRNKAGLWSRRDAIVPDPGGNETFKRMAAAFQAERKEKKKNNIWGSLIQEESLSSTMSGFGVKRSLNELGSDRGAETYDFTIPMEERAREREQKRKERMKNAEMDGEMDSYWTNDGKSETMDEEGGEADKPGEAGDQAEETKIDVGEPGDERRGTKRSVKDRLGTKRVRLDRFNGERLAAPGEAKHLIDIGEEDLLENSEEDFSDLLAERLGEDKPELIEGIVKKFGKTVAHKLYKLTQKTELNGGLEIHNGARRRTSGGVFLYLLKQDSSLKVDQEEVKKFLADSKKQEDRKILEAKRRKREKDFDKEMREFLSLRRELKEDDKKDKDGEGAEGEAMEADKVDEGNEDEECIRFGKNAFSSVIGTLSKKKPENSQVDRLKRFQEPDAPPNSVERVDTVDRTLTEYDDEDLFS